MPTFRFHKGSLNESMKTCRVVNNKNELAKLITSWNHGFERERLKDDPVCIGHYCSPDDLSINFYAFDKRIGWNTHIVMHKSGCVTRDDYVIGFLSDNFCENNQ